MDIPRKLVEDDDLSEPAPRGAPPLIQFAPYRSLMGLAEPPLDGSIKRPTPAPTLLRFGFPEPELNDVVVTHGPALRLITFLTVPTIRPPALPVFHGQDPDILITSPAYKGKLHKLLSPIIVNLIYALLGGVITLVFMWIGYFVINKFTPFNIAQELASGNRAVGSMVMGMFIGIGIAMGLVIGLSLN